MAIGFLAVVKRIDRLDVGELLREKKLPLVHVPPLAPMAKGIVRQRRRQPSRASR